VASKKTGEKTSTAGSNAGATKKKTNPNTDKKKMALAKVAAAKQRAKSMFSMMREQPDVILSSDKEGIERPVLMTTLIQFLNQKFRAFISQLVEMRLFQLQRKLNL